MCSVPGLPEAKAVVVLSGKNNPFHTGGFHSRAPLVGIEGLQVKNPGVFHPRPPLHPGKGVGPEVDKCDKFILEGSVLIGGGKNGC